MGKPLTASTSAILEAAEQTLPIGDFSDGSLIADHTSEVLIAPLPGGEAAKTYDASAARTERPERLHPVLLPQFQYQGNVGGLYRLSDGLYQIRDGLIYTTLVRGDTGWIIIDVGLIAEATASLWAFAREHLPGGADVPVSAVIYSHSHADHFGGVKGFISQAEADAGTVDVIAPHGFMDELTAESIIAGPAMRRRAEYSFGRLLEPKPDASELAFSTLPPGTISLIAPTIELPEGPGEITVREVDGVTIYFKDISGAEAPASTLMYLPKYKMIFNSE
ncbi:MAG: MBL fold metallo-hydrolase, partial [Pseudomonadota bacterium]